MMLSSKRLLSSENVANGKTKTSLGVDCNESEIDFYTPFKQADLYKSFSNERFSRQNDFFIGILIYVFAN